MIARVLGRSVAEVQTQIMGLGRIQQGNDWSRAEIKQLKAIYGSRTDEDLALVFGRSVHEVRRLSAEMTLSKDKAFMRRLRGKRATRMPRWRDEELELLRARYACESNLDLARRLGRSAKSVQSKAQALGLGKSSERLREMGVRNVSVRHRSS